MSSSSSSLANNGGGGIEERNIKKWKFQQDNDIGSVSAMTVRTVIHTLMESLPLSHHSQIIPLGHGDPSHFPSFRPPSTAEEAIVTSLNSAKFNSYCPFSNGLPSARQAVADYLSPKLPHRLSSDDIFLTIGCNHAIEIILRSLSKPGANILLPRPGFPYYESFAATFHFEARHFDLLPSRHWEVDIQSLEAAADSNTVAVVIINPGNPTGCVYSRRHLHEIAQVATRLGILVIADEVYDRIAFGDDPFVSMGEFGSMVPVVTLGSISKRWCVPGWRLGWIVTNDPLGIIRKSGLKKRIMDCLSISSDPPTFLQGALPDILANTKEDYFAKILKLLKQTADTCYTTITEIPCITCPNKPQGSMFMMVKLNVSMLDDISDDMDFCVKLANEECVILLPGVALGMANWLRITFAVEPSILEDGLARIKAFCQRHSKKQ